MKLMVEDTETSATTCLDKVKALQAQGVQLFVGPQASGELRGIKAYCDANKLLVISQSSTATSLSIAGDYIFRFCPDDNIQGPALARMMYGLGVRYVIPVYRGDAWGDGLKDSTKAVFERLGGTFLDGVRYLVDPTPATFTGEAATLANKVTAAVIQYGSDKVGVLDIAFEEATRFLLDAREHSVLWTVKWFGSDGTVQLDAMVQDAAVAEFATTVKFPNTIFAPTVSAKYETVRLYCNATLGRMPDAYVYSAYDEIWAYALCLLQVDKYDAEAVRAVMPDVTRNYFGASGWVLLNAYGDRAQADYDIWAIQYKDGSYKWVRAGTWIATSDSISWNVSL
jgi:branched-chain amino acid transport system substrate-binding protein